MKKSEQSKYPLNPPHRQPIMSAHAGGVSVWLNYYKVTERLQGWMGPLITQPMIEGAAEEGMPVLDIKAGQRIVHFPITGMTEEALDCFVAAIAEAAEEIRPEIRAIDERVKENQRERGISDQRLYQTVPQIRHRNGEITFYVEGLPVRFEGTEHLGDQSTS